MEPPLGYARRFFHFESLYELNFGSGYLHTRAWMNTDDTRIDGSNGLNKKGDVTLLHHSSEKYQLMIVGVLYLYIDIVDV
jgi:hypothetical protein